MSLQKGKQHEKKRREIIADLQKMREEKGDNNLHLKLKIRNKVENKTINENCHYSSLKGENNKSELSFPAKLAVKNSLAKAAGHCLDNGAADGNVERNQENFFVRVLSAVVSLVVLA